MVPSSLPDSDGLSSFRRRYSVPTATPSAPPRSCISSREALKSTTSSSVVECDLALTTIAAYSEAGLRLAWVPM